MKRMSRGASAVSRPARSPFFTSAGPLVTWSATPSSVARMWASEVLPRPGRAGEEHVVERLAALPGRLGVDPEVVDELLLPDVLVERGRAQRLLEPLLALLGPSRNVARRPYRHAGNVALVSDRLDGRFDFLRAVALLGRRGAGRRLRAGPSRPAAARSGNALHAGRRGRLRHRGDRGGRLQSVVHPRPGRDPGLLRQQRPVPLPLRGRAGPPVRRPGAGSTPAR